MLQETLLDIQIYLNQLNKKEILVTTKKIDEILDYFSNFKRGSILFPTKFMSALSLDVETSYSILKKLQSEGILYSLFEIHCPGCNITYNTYYSLLDIPTEIYCDECEEYKKPYLKVKYEVMRD